MAYSPRNILLVLALILTAVSFIAPIPLQIPLLLVTVALLIP